jgi:hypothetical protein
VSDDARVKSNLAAIRERMVEALSGDEDALKVLDRVWPASWSEAPLAVVWLLGNAARFADRDDVLIDPQEWLDRLVWPDGEPKEAGAGAIPPPPCSWARYQEVIGRNALDGDVDRSAGDSEGEWRLAGEFYAWAERNLT